MEAIPKENGQMPIIADSHATVCRQKPLHRLSPIVNITLKYYTIPLQEDNFTTAAHSCSALKLEVLQLLCAFPSAPLSTNPDKSWTLLVKQILTLSHLAPSPSPTHTRRDPAEWQETGALHLMADGRAMGGWSTSLVKHFTPEKARLTILASPDKQCH